VFLFLKQGLLQRPAISKTISGARRTVIVDWDTFHAVPGSRATPEHVAAGTA
jgi:hypothetical protein